MSIIHQFTNSSGEKINIAWGIRLQTGVPTQIYDKGVYSNYYSASTLFIKYIDSVDYRNKLNIMLNRISYINIIDLGISPNSPYPQLAPLKNVEFKWTCKNGNYMICTQVSNGGNINCKCYTADGKYIGPASISGGSENGATVFYELSSEEWETSVATNFLKLIPRLTGATTTNYVNVNIQSQTRDPFKLVLLSGSFIPPSIKPNDPFAPDVTTPDTENKPDGEFDQNGEFNDTNDKIDDTQLPPDTAGAVGTGFISLYTPNFAQLNQLATFLWSPTFADTISKLFANPFEVIMNLHTMPFIVPQGATQNIQCGNVPTNVSAPLVKSQFYTYDFGMVKIPKFSGTYLDFSPYTSYKITLPYMSTYSLNTDEITGKTLGLKYHIDIATGDTVAVISVDGQDTYTFTGNIATNIPITQGDYTNFWTTLTKATFDTAQTAVAVGAGGASQATGGVGALSSSVETVMQQKPEIRTSGVLGSNFGNFGTLRPYITKIKPNLLIPENQQTYTGFASYFVTSIGECKGYNQFTDIILKGFDYATDEEKAMIKSELEKGVIL